MPVPFEMEPAYVDVEAEFTVRDAEPVAVEVIKPAVLPLRAPTNRLRPLRSSVPPFTAKPPVPNAESLPTRKIPASSVVPPE